MPFKSWGCGICKKQAPKALREHNKFLERMKWLRHHYQKEHPDDFKQWNHK